MNQSDGVVPIRIDMSAMVRRSVASLYSHLVTRPTGRALRHGIESQIAELGAVCVSILDFRQVVVLDYSCADEAVAKLILRYTDDTRPTDAYFVLRGIGEHHRDTIEAVLERHRLSLVAELPWEGFTVLGQLSSAEQEAWRALCHVREGGPDHVASLLSVPEAEAAALLAVLAERRLVVQRGPDARYLALPALVAEI